MNTAGAANARVFYGWIVVAATFTILFVGFGSSYAFTTFFAPLQAEFQATRGSISLAFAIGGALYFSTGALAGPLADRVGHRWMILLGIVILGGGYLLAARATALWQVYLAYGLGVGLGIGLCYTPSVGAIQPWFNRRRGFASGLAVAGIGIGTLAVPPLAAWLIHIAGWRAAYVALGLFVLGPGLIAGWLIDASPQRRGSHPEGTAPASAASVELAVSLAAAMRTRAFWLLYGSNFTLSFSLLIPFVHFLPYTQDLGISRATGVALFSLIGVGSAAGRFLLGGLADLWGRTAALVAMCAGVAAMFAWWLLSTAVWQLALFATLFGAFYGGYVALLPAATADYFGSRHVSAIIGVLYTSVAAGFLAGPTLAGVAFDLQGSYTLPMVASLIVSLLATALTAALLRPGPGRPGPA